MKQFLNKEVQIFPSDSRRKFGIVKEINEHGVVFQITQTEDNRQQKGDLWFVSYSLNLNFILR